MPEKDRYPNAALDVLNYLFLGAMAGVSENDTDFENRCLEILFKSDVLTKSMMCWSVKLFTGVWTLKCNILPQVPDKFSNYCAGEI